MGDFKKYFEDEDVKKTLAKLPQAIQELVKGYKISFQPRNTLAHDKQHVGMITNHPKKEINVSSPWNVGREFTLLHEISHLAYEKWIRGSKWEKEWEGIVKDTKDKKKDETPEELWCHHFANSFVKYPLVIHSHPTWKAYLDRFLKAIK